MPLVKGGQNLSPLVGIRLTDLQNVGLDPLALPVPASLRLVLLEAKSLTKLNYIVKLQIDPITLSQNSTKQLHIFFLLTGLSSLGVPGTPRFWRIS